MSTKILRGALRVGVLSLLGSGISVYADTTFDFNSLASGAASSGGVGTNASIKNYMNSVCGGCVTSVTGAVADKTYNGEGFATGPGSGSHSLTLGTSDGATASNTNSTLHAGGAYDTFIATTNDSSSQISTEMVIKFATAITGTISFDFEIFPDAAGNPDFTFEAKNSGGTIVNNWTQLGLTPGTTDGNSKKSPNNNTETNKQYIGVWSGSVTGVTELDFIDWPATIGIDNLTIGSSVPEPGSMALLGTSLAGFFWLQRKRRKA